MPKKITLNILHDKLIDHVKEDSVILAIPIANTVETTNTYCDYAALKNIEPNLDAYLVDSIKKNDIQILKHNHNCHFARFPIEGNTFESGLDVINRYHARTYRLLCKMYPDYKVYIPSLSNYGFNFEKDIKPIYEDYFKDLKNIFIVE